MNESKSPPQIVAASEPGSETHALAAFIGQELEHWGFTVEPSPAPSVLHVAAKGKLFTVCTYVRVRG